MIASPPTPCPDGAGAGDPERRDEGVDRQPVAGFTFDIAETHCPDAAARWGRVADTLAAYLVAEWEQKQQTAPVANSLSGRLEA
jgi:hypothetical protein